MWRILQWIFLPFAERLLSWGGGDWLRRSCDAVLLSSNASAGSGRLKIHWWLWRRNTYVYMCVCALGTISDRWKGKHSACLSRRVAATPLGLYGYCSYILDQKIIVGFARAASAESSITEIRTRSSNLIEGASRPLYTFSPCVSVRASRENFCLCVPLLAPLSALGVKMRARVYVCLLVSSFHTSQN